MSICSGLRDTRKCRFISGRMTWITTFPVLIALANLPQDWKRCRFLPSERFDAKNSPFSIKSFWWKNLLWTFWGRRKVNIQHSIFSALFFPLWYFSEIGNVMIQCWLRMIHHQFEKFSMTLSNTQLVFISFNNIVTFISYESFIHWGRILVYCSVNFNYFLKNFKSPKEFERIYHFFGQLWFVKKKFCLLFLS